MNRIAIDVGGTFTDCLVIDGSGEIREFKVPSRPPDFVDGVLDSLGKSSSDCGVSLSDFLGQTSVIIHGTTIATNAILTGAGARVGMITTKGFRDIYEIRRGYKLSSMYNLFVPPYKPLVPRYLRVGVAERTLYTGEVPVPLNEKEVKAAMDYLTNEGVESVAICFLHSYANPQTEKQALQICANASPRVYAVASHEVLPVWREYERFSTTVLSAYIGPLTDRYFSTLEERLRKAGFKGTLLMVLNNGLTEPVEYCRRQPACFIGSGPAAQPVAGLYFTRETGHTNFLTLDIGGTSTDVCVVPNSEIPATREGWVGDERIALRMVDVSSLGAGGGAIAWIDSLGVLRVGPASAAAKPGPACYGKSGQEPTLTDACLLLGYIPHDYFLGGEVPLNKNLARAAVGKLCQQLGLGMTETAYSIFAVASTNIAGLISNATTKRGYDVRDFTMIAGGGAGPVLCASLAEELGIQTIIVPRLASLYSAFGMLLMDTGFEYSRSYLSRADKIDFEKLNGIFAEMELQALEKLGSLGIARKNVVLTRSADMRYDGQFHEVEVGIPGGKCTPRKIKTAVDAFHKKHQQLHLFSMPNQDVEFLTFHLRVSAPQSRVNLPTLGTGTHDASAALKRRRPGWFNGAWVDTPIYEGKLLQGKNLVLGPAVIEEPTTTVIIPPGFKCTVSEHSYYVLTRSDSR